MQRSLLTLTLAGCLAVCACGSEDENAQTLPNATQSSADESPDPMHSSADEEPTTEAGVVLTQDQVDAALPTVADLPTGWAEDPDNTAVGDDEDDDSDTVSPPECARILDALDEQSTDPMVTASASFAKGQLGPFLGVEVKSFEPGQEPDQSDYQALLDAISSCGTFTSTDADGMTAEFTATALSFPQLGDATVALRVSANASGLSFTGDFVNVTSGNNTVGATSLAFAGTPDTELMESVTRTTLDRLDEISA